jgi:4-hydroxybenzoate polyprenyltransferase
MISPESKLPLLRRLWIYQAERFPLARTALLVAVFASASVSVSAHLGRRDLPSWPSYVVAFLAVLVFFYQLRASDEVKDREDDAKFRPERAIPRGLVSLRLIVGIAIAAAPISAILAGALDVRLLLLLAAVWLWMVLMGMEFFAATWLRGKPFIYLVSHMLIMPLIDLFATGCEWVPAGSGPPRMLWLFLVLSFLNGTVLEIGRKIYAPVNERTGVETYSQLLGPLQATMLWCAAIAVALGCLLAVGVAEGSLPWIAAFSVIAAGFSILCAVAFMRHPVPKYQKLIDTASGLWVLLCYASAGFVPIVVEALSSWT